MKKILYLIPLAALFFSCVKENDATDADSAIRFSAEAAAPETKVSYSGADDAGKERIEWGVGDRFSVWCNESAVTKVASYSVSGPAADYIDNTGATSTASEVGAVSSSSVLEWGSSPSYQFYARYPDPTWTAGAPTETAYTSQGLNSSNFTCVIPAAQTPTRYGSTFTYLPQMKYCYMAAYANVAKKGTVALNFTPVVSCFEISIANSYISLNESFVVSKVELISSSKRLNGTYTVAIGAPSTFDVPASSGEDDRKITFTPNMTVTSGQTLKFTVFTCPVDIAGTDGDHLSVKIYLSNGDIRTKELKNGGAWLSYAAGGKYRIDCGTVPDPYNYNINTDVDDLVINCNGSQKQATFKLFSTKNKLGLITASPWKAQYSVDGGLTWADGPYANTNTEATGGFYIYPSSGNGNVNGETITAYMPGGASTTTTNTYTTYHFRTPKGNSVTPIDLSLYNTVDDLDLENPLSQESANCYIIRAEGYYKIPLSYGNSIKAGAANTSSFTSQGQTLDSDYSSCKLIGTVDDPFVNGLGHAINAGNYKISPTASYTVAISTQDTATSSVTDCVESLVIDGDYIKFHVTENINPCNVVIKVTDGEDTPTTVWSYHLWMVPNETALEPRHVYDSGQNILLSMLSANLGQTPPSSISITSYPELNIMIRFVSTRDNSLDPVKSTSLNITRPDCITAIEMGGMVVNPFYQIGRKDPMLSPVIPGKYMRAKGTTYKGEDTREYTSGYTLSIDYSVSHPEDYLTGRWYNTSGAPYINLWDTAQSGRIHNPSPKKSVYDPSPRGYHVACRDDFGTLANNSTKLKTEWSTWSEGSGKMGFLFYISNGTEIHALPASGQHMSSYSYSSPFSNVGTYGYISLSALGSVTYFSYDYWYPAGNYGVDTANGFSVRPVKD